MADGTLYVAELASSNLVKVSADGKQRSTVAKELRGPVALARGKDDLIYVTEIAAGAVTEINVATGARKRRGRRPGRAGGHRRRARRPSVRRRGRPEARGRHRSRDRRQDGDRLQPRYRPAALSGRTAGLVPTGVAVGAGGTVYVSSDIRNALYKLTPPAP